MNRFFYALAHSERKVALMLFEIFVVVLILTSKQIKGREVYDNYDTVKIHVSVNNTAPNSPNIRGLQNNIIIGIQYSAESHIHARYTWLHERTGIARADQKPRQRANLLR